MQGGPGGERTEPLYMRPPTDPIAAAVFEYLGVQELYEVVGSLYGLANSPHSWYLEIKRRLLELGFVVSTLDCCMFM